MNSHSDSMARSLFHDYGLPHVDPGTLEPVLAASLRDPDPLCPAATGALVAAGLGRAAATAVLAGYRSLSRYGYAIAPATMAQLQPLAAGGTADAVAAGALLAHPVILMKAAWLYEHAPYFALRGVQKPGARDALIGRFLEACRCGLFARHWDFSAWQPGAAPRRVRRTAFWDQSGMDPVQLVKATADAGLEGFELSVDFHPFNFHRMLPEEFTPALRQELREAINRSGITVDIHAPIVGPYVPAPDPKVGRQRLFDPASCLAVQLDTVALAMEIGAEAVVFHVIDAENLEPLAQLVRKAAGSSLHVTFENYCQLGCPQTSAVFLATLDRLRALLPANLFRDNFGVTLDLGHLNIDGEDPLVGAANVGRWCRDNHAFIRMHATDNYGKLLFAPPHFSADVHANVTGRGINNPAAIVMLRSLGLRPAVVAEQINPLSREDIDTIHSAQTVALTGSFDEFVDQGTRRLAKEETGEFLRGCYLTDPAYRFLAGYSGVQALQEYAVYRRIQDKTHLSVEEARRISEDFMKMPEALKKNLPAYLDALLLPVQTETGDESKTQLDLVCQNLSGPAFWTAGVENADQVFATDRIYRSGDVVCEHGQTGDEMFFVKAGAIEILLEGVRVTTLGPGEIFGEISLFYNIPRSATARVAADGTRLGVLSRSDLQSILECRHAGAYELVVRLYRMLPERLRNMNDKYRSAIRALQLIGGADEKTLEGLERAAMAMPLQRQTSALPLFTADDIGAVCEQRLAFAAGQTVIEQGDAATGVYFVLHGKLQVVAPGVDGPDVALGEVGTGEIFGEMALIDDKPRSARVKAIGACELAFIARPTFLSLIQARSPLAFRLMGFICVSLFQRILRLDRIYSEIKRHHRHLVNRGGKSGEKVFSTDIIETIFVHRLQQTDLDRILQELSTSQRDILVAKIGDLLRRISALVEVSSRMSDTLSLDILLPRLMSIITDAVNADRSTLFLNDPDTSELFSRIAQGEAIREIRFPNHQGIAGSVFTSGEALVIHDAYADVRFNPEVDKRTGYRTRNILCIPLKNKGRMMGVTQVLNKNEGNFDDGDMRLLEALTSQAVSALENAQLYERVEKARKEEARLLEVTSAIASELHLDTLLTKVIGATTEMLDADRSTLFMYDAKKNELWSRIAEGLGAREIRFPAHAGIAGHCFTAGAVVNIPDAYADERFNPAVDKKTGYRTRSILCLPVSNKNGDKLAVIQVLNKRGGPFGPQDERRLRTFCAQVAIALDNAKLFEDVKNERNYNESILKSLSNGVITLDSACRIIKVNAAAQQMLHWQEIDVVDRSLCEIFTQPSNVWLIESLNKVIHSGAVDITMDAELSLATAGIVSLNTTVVPLIDVNEKPIGYMLVLEDITTEKRVKSTMARYMTKEVADRLLSSEEDALGGVAQIATVLFSDIRGFTTISEDIGPRETVSLLNDYFTCMVDVIFAHNGILDKYLADGLMALFGAPFPGPEDADHAMAVANDMIRSLARFNQSRALAGKTELRVGVGVSTGELVAGNIGSPKRMDYTVIGDPANLASRLESATKYYHVPILFSEFTFQRLKRPVRCRAIDQLRVVGKRKPVTIYEALDHFTPQTFPRMDEVLLAFEKGLACYRKCEWDKAVSQFQAALAAHPHDGVSKLYVERCLHLKQNPPAASWDGVWILDRK